jgi:hypothetical protein
MRVPGVWAQAAQPAITIIVFILHEGDTQQPGCPRTNSTSNNNVLQIDSLLRFLLILQAHRNPLQNQAKAQQPKAQVHEGLLHKGHLSVDI